MFNANLVAVVKANGKVLREDRSNGTAPTVYLPFKSEYSILLKNLNSKRAVVSISIDGQDVLDGRKIVLDGNSEREIERFLSDDLKRGNRFKFIEKTEEISDYRGDRVDDGIIRIEYQYEAPVAYWYNTTYGGGLLRSNYYDSRIGSVYNCSVGSSSAVCDGFATASLGNMNLNCDSRSIVNDDGITVKGSVSNQQFTETTVGALESDKYVMTLMLRGKTAQTKVAAPVTVEVKTTCPTCGRTYKGFPKFCANCGTALVK